MKIERYYTVFGNKHIDAGQIGGISNINDLLKKIWTYANGASCSAVLSISYGRSLFLKAGNMEEPLEITGRMISCLMDLTQEEYQSLFIELIRASIAINSRMNVREVFEINLNPTREMNQDELNRLNDYHCVTPDCLSTDVVCLHTNVDSNNEEVCEYICNECGAKWSLWKQTISGIMLKEGK